MSKIFNYFDLKFHREDWISIIVLILSLVWAKLFNVGEILENTIYENLAVIPLIIGIILCLRAKKYKVLFRVGAMVLFLLIAREFSYGRVPFAHLPGNIHDFYPWSHYKYGFLAHIAVGVYIAFIALYSIINKIWLDIVGILKEVKFPLVTFLLTVIFTFIQVYSEHTLENTVIEEISETCIYCLVLTFCIIYVKKINKNTDNA